MLYKVAITEILRKVVTVDARDEAEAHQRISDAWWNGEFCLTAEDTDGAEFHVLGEDDGEDYEQVDGKDILFVPSVP